MRRAAALRGWQVTEPPLPVSDAQIDDLPAVAQLVSLPHFGFYSRSSPTRWSPGTRRDRGGRGGVGSGGGHCRDRQNSNTHSFPCLLATRLHAKKKEKEGKSSRMRVLLRRVGAGVKGLEPAGSGPEHLSAKMRAHASGDGKEPGNYKQICAQSVLKK